MMIMPITLHQGKFESSASVDDKSDFIQPKDFILYQNYPNPFNPSTVINYELLVGGKVTLRIYDILGKEIATLVNEERSPGKYEIEFSIGQSVGSGFSPDVSSGIYFYRLSVNGYSETKSMILLK